MPATFTEIVIKDIREVFLQHIKSEYTCAFYSAQKPHKYITVSTNYYTLFFLFFKLFETLNRLKAVFSAV
jgi:hypothetical protein